jgi:hypothetical protein
MLRNGSVIYCSLLGPGKRSILKQRASISGNAKSRRKRAQEISRGKVMRRAGAKKTDVESKTWNLERAGRRPARFFAGK